MINKRLGEIVLRTQNLDSMKNFYRDVIELDEYNTLGSATF
jgi:catechol-2,3-dioxygenase